MAGLSFGFVGSSSSSSSSAPSITLEALVAYFNENRSHNFRLNTVMLRDERITNLLKSLLVKLISQGFILQELDSCLTRFYKLAIIITGFETNSQGYCKNIEEAVRLLTILNLIFDIAATPFYQKLDFKGDDARTTTRNLIELLSLINDFAIYVGTTEPSTNLVLNSLGVAYGRFMFKFRGSPNANGFLALIIMRLKFAMLAVREAGLNLSELSEIQKEYIFQSITADFEGEEYKKELDEAIMVVKAQYAPEAVADEFADLLIPVPDGSEGIAEVDLDSLPSLFNDAEEDAEADAEVEEILRSQSSGGFMAFASSAANRAGSFAATVKRTAARGLSPLTRKKQKPSTASSEISDQSAMAFCQQLINRIIDENTDLTDEHKQNLKDKLLGAAYIGKDEYLLKLTLIIMTLSENPDRQIIGNFLSYLKNPSIASGLLVDCTKVWFGWGNVAPRLGAQRSEIQEILQSSNIQTLLGRVKAAMIQQQADRSESPSDLAHKAMSAEDADFALLDDASLDELDLDTLFADVSQGYGAGASSSSSQEFRR